MQEPIVVRARVPPGNLRRTEQLSIGLNQQDVFYSHNVETRVDCRAESLAGPLERSGSISKIQGRRENEGQRNAAPDRRGKNQRSQTTTPQVPPPSRAKPLQGPQPERGPRSYASRETCSA